MRHPIVAVLLLGFALACGGGGGTTPIQPAYQPQIVNFTDSFSLQLTGVNDGSGQLVYGWHNTGTSAKVNRSCAISAGTVTLTVKDSAGTTVYAGALNGMSGSVSTGVGVAGTWTIQTDFAHATGTINFSAQKL
jgi:hypothetical protein